MNAPGIHRVAASNHPLSNNSVSSPKLNDIMPRSNLQ